MRIKFTNKLPALALALALALTLVACGGGNGNTTGGEDGNEPYSAASTDSKGGQTSSTAAPANAKTAQEGYLAYKMARAKPATLLLYGGSDLEQASEDMNTMAVLGDSALLCGAVFGTDKTTAANRLQTVASLTDVTYQESGGKVSMTAMDSKGVAVTCTGSYDAANDYMLSELKSEGETSAFTPAKTVINVVAEYRATDYGYVAQYYIADTKTRYLLTISGAEICCFGKEQNAGKPSALTGKEKTDAPKSLPSWFTVDGKHFTGLTDDGKSVDLQK